MDIELNEERINLELVNVVDKYKATKIIDVSPICDKMDSLITGAEHCKDMIQNRDTMSPETICETLGEFAFIYTWNDYDFISIINMANGMKFVGEKTISTRMQVKAGEQGKALDGTEEEVSVDLRVLYTEDTTLDNHDYAKKEIKKLLNEGRILILEEVKGRAKGKNYWGEAYYHFESILDKDPETEFLSKSSRFYPYTLQYIKEQLTKEKLKDLFFRHLQHVNNEFDEASQLDYTDRKKRHVNEKCQEEFEHRGYTRRLVKLNSIKKRDL